MKVIPLSTRNTNGYNVVTSVSAIRLNDDASQLLALEGSWARLHMNRLSGDGKDKWKSVISPRINGNGNHAAIDRDGTRVLLSVGCPSGKESQSAQYSIWNVGTGRCQSIADSLPRVRAYGSLKASQNLDRVRTQQYGRLSARKHRQC